MEIDRDPSDLTGVSKTSVSTPSGGATAQAPQVVMPDFDSRFKAVRLSSLNGAYQDDLRLRVAGISLGLNFSEDWGKSSIASICAQHWAPFVQSTNTSEAEIEISLAPAEGETRSSEHPMWNLKDPFQFEIRDEKTGTWVFHRDFTALLTDQADGLQKRLLAWISEPSASMTDALDNILAFALQPLAERRQGFLFHASVVEHEGRAMVFFGPSGIGKSTLAKLSHEAGFKVMSSDQVYLRIDGDPNHICPRLVASASPTMNPDIPRDASHWSTGDLEVKGLFALRRSGRFEVYGVEQVEFARLFMAEIFQNDGRNGETGADGLNLRPAFDFASQVVKIPNLTKAVFSYPKGFDFWAKLKELGYT